MRLIVTVAALLSLGTVAAVVVAQDARTTVCTQIGTPDRDIMTGGNGPDVLCARGGDDYLGGGRGADTLRGDGGRDTIVGGPGQDTLKGLANDDRLFAVDGHPGDHLIGGGGHDDCYADPGDKVKGCEDTFRGASIRLARRLSQAFFGQGSLAVDLLGQVPTPTLPPPPVTVTVTVTVHTQPECLPPPSSPPPPC